MKLDQVVTVAIGRMDRNGNNLPLSSWTDVRDWVKDDCDANKYWWGGTIVAEGDIRGVTSDQDTQSHEDSYVVLVVNVEDVDRLRKEIALSIGAFKLTSACYAVDSTHEPVFSDTHDGRRAPAPAPAPVTSAAYAPTHGGYPSV